MRVVFLVDGVDSALVMLKRRRRMFSGGGMWEAMHDEMAGYFEVRVDGPKRHHYRLFCLLEREGESGGLNGPSIVLITGKDKPFRTVLSNADYADVRRLGDEYMAQLACPGAYSCEAQADAALRCPFCRDARAFFGAGTSSSL